MDPRKSAVTPTTKRLFEIRDALHEQTRARKGKGREVIPDGAALADTAGHDDDSDALNRLAPTTKMDYEEAYELALAAVVSPERLKDDNLRFSSDLFAMEVLELLLSTTLPLLNSDPSLRVLYSPAFLLNVGNTVYRAWGSGSTNFLQKCRNVMSQLLILSAKLDIPDLATFLHSEVLAAPWLFKRTISTFGILMKHLSTEQLEGMALCRGDESRAAGVLRRIVEGMGMSDDIANVSGKVAGDWIEKVWAEVGDEKNAADEDFWVSPVADVCRESAKGRGNIYYLLTDLFKKRKPAFKSLMVGGGLMMGEGGSTDEATLQAAVAILKVGNAQGLVDGSNATQSAASLVTLPSDLLSTCLMHASTSLRCAALSLLVVSPAATQIPSSTFSLLKTFYKYSLGDDDAEFRMETIALTGKLLLRLRESSWKASSASRKDDAYVAEVVDFVQWWFDYLLFNLNPAKPFRIQLGALRFLDLLYQSRLDTNFALPFVSASTSNGYSSYRRTAPTPAPGFQAKPKRATSNNTDRPKEVSLPATTSGWPFRIAMVTDRSTFHLLRLLLSTYTSLRTLTISILERFPSPLPGYDGAAGTLRAEQELLVPALKMVRSGREAEASAGAGIIGLVWRKWLLEGTQDWDLGRIGGWRVTAGKRKDGPAGFSFLNDLMDLADLQLAAHRNDLGRAAATAPMHGTLLALRQLFISIPIATYDSLWSAQELRTIFHRALKVVEDIWQVTAVVLAASAPEGSMIGSATLVDTEEARAQAFGGVDRDFEVDFEGAGGTGGPTHKIVLSATWRSMKEAGELLETLLRLPSELADETFRLVWSREEVQHIGDLYATWLARIRHRGTVMALHPCYSRACAALFLCKKRTDVQLLPLQWLDVHIDSITSQKISITRRSAGIPYSIMSILTVIVPTDRANFDRAFERIFAIAESESSEILDESRVHAMNTLRTAFQESKATAATLVYMERAFLVSISMFWSTNWICRNAAMMLFGALVTKAIGGGRTNVDRDFASLVHRLSISEFFTRYPRLPAVLLSELELSAGKHLDDVPVSDMHSSLFSVLMLLSLLQTPDSVTGSVLPTYRRMRNFVQLCGKSRVWKIRVAAADALTGLVSPAEVLQLCTGLLIGVEELDENELHGRFLQVHRVLLSSRPLSHSDEVFFTRALSELSGTILDGNRSLVVRSAYLDIASLVNGSSLVLERGRRLLQSVLTSPDDLSRLPSGEVYAHATFNYVKSCEKLSLKQLEAALQSPLLLMQRAALAHLRYSANEETTPPYVSTLLKVTLDQHSPPECRVLAAELLVNSKWTRFEARKALPDIVKELQSTQVVPLREALLPCAATLYNLIDDDEETNVLLEMLTVASAAVQSIESRDSTARALSQLASPSIHRSQPYARLLVRLLQDDDAAVRSIASNIVTRWWTQQTPLANSKQVETILDFAGVAPLSFYRSEMSADFDLLASPSSLLFVVEKPNIFIEETAEAEFEQTLITGAGPSHATDHVEQVASALAIAINTPLASAAAGPLGVMGNETFCKWSLRILARAHTNGVVQVLARDEQSLVELMQAATHSRICK